LTAKNNIAIRINAVDLKNRLRDIETDSRNRSHDLAPPNHRRLNSTHIHGALAPVEEPSTASIPETPRAIKLCERLAHGLVHGLQSVTRSRSPPPI
jgi:hypothetical protein